MNTVAWEPYQLERNRFVRFRTIYTFERFVDLRRDQPLKILDFGCGEGHSIDALWDYFPDARFVGADISPAQLSAFTTHFGNRPRVTIVPMRNPLDTQNLGEDFDVVQINALFEHLLPDERKALMPDLWQRLRPGGYFVVTETPSRWFLIDTHTTSWPLINYMPDSLALAAVRYCGRYPKSTTWQEALRAGVRGATCGEIISCIGASASAMEHVRSAKVDARDLLEIWWQGESRKTLLKTFTYQTLRWLQRSTGILISPWVNLVLRKVA